MSRLACSVSVCLLCAAASASPILMLSGPAQYTPGTPFVVELSLVGATGLAGFGMDVSLSASSGTAGTDYSFAAVADPSLNPAYVFNGLGPSFAAVNADPATSPYKVYVGDLTGRRAVDAARHGQGMAYPRVQAILAMEVPTQARPASHQPRDARHDLEAQPGESALGRGSDTRQPPAPSLRSALRGHYPQVHGQAQEPSRQVHHLGAVPEQSPRWPAPSLSASGGVAAGGLSHTAVGRLDQCFTDRSGSRKGGRLNPRN